MRTMRRAAPDVGGTAGGTYCRDRKRAAPYEVASEPRDHRGDTQTEIQVEFLKAAAC